MEGVVVWGWRNVRLDLWSGLFLFWGVFLAAFLLPPFSKSRKKQHRRARCIAPLQFPTRLDALKRAPAFQDWI